MNLKKQWLPITIILLVTGFLLLSIFNLKYRTEAEPCVYQAEEDTD